MSILSKKSIYFKYNLFINNRSVIKNTNNDVRDADLFDLINYLGMIGRIDSKGLYEKQDK